MSGPAISFVPKVGGSTLTIDFDTIEASLSGFVGDSRIVGESQVSVGGKAHSVAYDAYFVYQVSFTPVYYWANPGTSPFSLTQADNWRKFWAWMSWAKRGGEFTFAKDASKTWSTLVDGLQGQGDQNIQVDSDTGINDNDWFYIESINNPMHWERQRVDDILAGPILVVRGMSNDYPDNSPIRYHEYFPKCILEPLDQRIFTERRAGSGIDLWDINFTFRTVR